MTSGLIRAAVTIAWLGVVVGPAATTGSASSTGACPTTRMSSAIAGKWRELGGPGGVFGCPRTDEVDAGASPAASTGRAVEFGGGDGGLIYEVAPRGGAPAAVHEVHGCIFKVYNQVGRSGSWLGFPTSDEYDVPGGRRSDFEGGYVLWNAGNRQCEAFAAGTGPGVAGGAGAMGVGVAAIPTGGGATAGLTYVGADADKTSMWSYGPDGAPDGHFRLMVPKSGTIVSISMNGINEKGDKTSSAWDTKNAGIFLLAVELDGKPVNTDHVPTLGTFKGGTVLDLYATMGGEKFAPGTNYTVDVVYADGSMGTLTTTGASSMTGGAGGAAGGGSAGGPCSDPKTLAIMDEWLATAQPTAGPNLRYEPWGRAVGRSSSATLTTPLGKPDTNLSRCGWLLQLSPELGSTNLGTLQAYLAGKR